MGDSVVVVSVEKGVAMDESDCDGVDSGTDIVVDFVAVSSVVEDSSANIVVDDCVVGTAVDISVVDSYVVDSAVEDIAVNGSIPVSYTHLTLPTRRTV